MQNFARNSALAKILGLAKMRNFAKIAKFLLSLRNFRNPSKIFAILAKFPGMADFPLPCLLSSTASIFLQFAFILLLIFGLIDG